MTGGSSFSNQRRQELVELATTQLVRRMSTSIASTLSLLPAPLVESCAGLSLILDDEPGGPLDFRVELRGTTDAQVATELARGIPDSAARWALEHWIDIALWSLDTSAPSPEFRRTVQTWTSAELSANGTPDQGNSAFAHRVRTLLGQVGATLHHSGSVERVFRKSLPLIVQSPPGSGLFASIERTMHPSLPRSPNRSMRDLEWCKEVTAHANPWASKSQRRSWFAYAS